MSTSQTLIGQHSEEIYDFFENKAVKEHSSLLMAMFNIFIERGPAAATELIKEGIKLLNISGSYFWNRGVPTTAEEALELLFIMDMAIEKDGCDDLDVVTSVLAVFAIQLGATAQWSSVGDLSLGTSTGAYGIITETPENRLSYCIRMFCTGVSYEYSTC